MGLLGPISVRCGRVELHVYGRDGSVFFDVLVQEFRTEHGQNRPIGFAIHRPLLLHLGSKRVVGQGCEARSGPEEELQ